MKILAVDLSSVCRTFWEIYQSGKLTDGEPFRAAVERVKRAADGFDRVVVACDVGPSFRKLHCPTYKASRPDPGPAYRQMVKEVAERLYKDGATVFPNREEEKKLRSPTVGITSQSPQDPLAQAVFYYPEADDIIASLAAWYRREIDPRGDIEHAHLRILSGDTDTWALVNDNSGIDVEPVVSWVSKVDLTRKIVHEEDVRAKFGGVGSWVTEVKALAGDDGDGYKPFPHHDPDKKGGIGLDTAIELLKMAPGQGASEVVAMANDPVHGEKIGTHIRKCLLVARGGGLEVGYPCARMLTDLPLGFERILVEPKVVPITEPRPQSRQELAPRRPSSSPPPAEAPMMRQETRLDRNALQPRDTMTLWDRAAMIYDSRMFPQFKSQAAIATGIVILQEMGFRMGALRHLYDIKGRLGFSAALLVAAVRKSRTCKRFQLVSGPLDSTAVVEFQRSDMPEPRRYEFTEDMAKKLGSSGEPWQKSRHVMKAWAAMRECARLHWPEIVGGLHTPDEIRSGLTEDDFVAEVLAFDENEVRP